jgi:hypothetical protein
MASALACTALTYLPMMTSALVNWACILKLIPLQRA